MLKEHDSFMIDTFFNQVCNFLSFTFREESTYILISVIASCTTDRQKKIVELSEKEEISFRSPVFCDCCNLFLASWREKLVIMYGFFFFSNMLYPQLMLNASEL
jgi:hypothetical protein